MVKSKKKTAIKYRLSLIDNCCHTVWVLVVCRRLSEPTQQSSPKHRVQDEVVEFCCQDTQENNQGASLPLEHQGVFFERFLTKYLDTLTNAEVLRDQPCKYLDYFLGVYT